jgi:hypothetical protein
MLTRILLTWALIFSANVPTTADEKEKYHPVKPEELLELIQEADKVVIYDVGYEVVKRANPSRGPVVLYSSSDPKDISELKAAVTIEAPKSWFRCACIPSIEIALLRKGKKLGIILVYEGQTVGFSRWSSDVRIRDVEKWLRWFDARKISGPQQEVQREREQEEADRIALDRWMKAMPTILRPVWPKTMETMEPGQKVDTKELEVNLAKEFPDVPQRIRALMSWYGSGKGPWSGFPMYEDIAEEMLLGYQTAELVAAARDGTLTEQQKEGAARLFAGWDFNTRRPADNALIPDGLKQSLLEHSLKSSDDDKIARARNAFERK